MKSAYGSDRTYFDISRHITLDRLERHRKEVCLPLARYIHDESISFLSFSFFLFLILLPLTRTKQTHNRLRGLQELSCIDLIITPNCNVFEVTLRSFKEGRHCCFLLVSELRKIKNKKRQLYCGSFYIIISRC